MIRVTQEVGRPYLLACRLIWIWTYHFILILLLANGNVITHFFGLTVTPVTWTCHHLFTIIPSDPVINFMASCEFRKSFFEAETGTPTNRGFFLVRPKTRKEARVTLEPKSVTNNWFRRAQSSVTKCCYSYRHVELKIHKDQQRFTFSTPRAAETTRSPTSLTS